jgi:hypothetical protein
MKQLKKHIRPLLLMLSIPIMGALYIIINKFSSSGHDVTIALDNSIPYIKIFIIPYILWYLFIPIVFIILYTYDKKVYYKTMLVYIIGYIISCSIFILYQTTVPRTILTGSDIFTEIISLIRFNDKPLNCLPSLHVFTCYIMIKAIGKSNLGSIKNKIIISIISYTIILSTLFTKQHAILDVLAGIVLGEALIYIINKSEGKLYLLRNKKPFIYFFINKTT